MFPRETLRDSTLTKVLVGNRSCATRPRVAQRSKVPTIGHHGAFFLVGRMGRGEVKSEQILGRFFRGT